MGVNRTKAWRLALTILGVSLAGAAAPVQPALARAAVATSRQIPFTAAEATSPDGGASFMIAWTAPARTGPVRVFARKSPGLGGGARLVGHGGASGHIKVSGLPAADRWYFDLKPAHGADLVTADRALHLATAPNFRDVGGYRTADGRWVRMGLVYRSEIGRAHV